MSARLLYVLVFLATAVPLAGCGGGLGDAPDVAPVSGKVTLNGQALPGVSVLYEPIEVPEKKVASSSSAMTNEQGEYELVFSRDLMGAMIGKHRVKLVKDEELDEDGNKVPNAVIIPPQYNSRTELEVDVPPEGLDGGAANFELDICS